MTVSGRIYLDNAATSFPKPPGVSRAVSRYIDELGASPGRGGYSESREGAALLTRCRERVCAFIGGASANHVIFTLNASDALNMAIKGIAIHQRRANPRARVHMVTTAMDHNSVLRPLNDLVQDGIRWTCVPADSETGLVDLHDLESAIEDDTALVCVVHASNVSGTIQPIRDIARACNARAVPILVDAAQSLGHLPVDVRSMGIDLLAFPGHKGLLGPLGTGGLYLRPGMEDVVATYREGGTGSRSDEDVHPATMPDRYEPGSHNMPGIAGLHESLGWLLERGVDSIREHEISLIDRVLGRLDELRAAGYTLVGPKSAEHRVGVFSFWHTRIAASEIAARLELAGFLARAGLQCAPRAHRALGTPVVEGTVRLSVSPFVKVADIDRALDELVRIGQGSCEASQGTIHPEVRIRTSDLPTTQH